jgi:hypothetical protein
MMPAASVLARCAVRATTRSRVVFDTGTRAAISWSSGAGTKGAASRSIRSDCGPRPACHAAERQPDEVSLADPEPVEQGDEVVGQVIDRVGTVRDGETAVPAGVVADNPEPFLQGGDLGIPHLVCGPKRVREDDGTVRVAGDDGVSRHGVDRTSSKTAASRLAEHGVRACVHVYDPKDIA